MSNENLAIGLTPVNMPYGNVRRRMHYCDGTQNSTTIAIGDPVVLDTTGTIIRATEGVGNRIGGVCVGCYDSNKSPIGWLTASTAGYVSVCDDPDQQYLCQEDGDTSDLATTDIGSNVDLVSAAVNTFRQRSGFMLDSSSVTTSTNAQLRIIAKQDRVNNDVGDYCKWIVKVNYTQINPEEGGDSI